MKFKVGDKVSLKKGIYCVCSQEVVNHRTAKIGAFLLSTAEGAVYLDRPLKGYQYWNTSDLKKVE